MHAGGRDAACRWHLPEGEATFMGPRSLSRLDPRIPTAVDQAARGKVRTDEHKLITGSERCGQDRWEKNLFSPLAKKCEDKLKATQNTHTTPTKSLFIGHQSGHE